MRKLWRDVKAHKLTVLLFFVYWLATLVVVPFAWNSGIPSWVMRLLFSVPLIAGFFVGWWRFSTQEGTAPSGNRFKGGMLAGLLCAEITFFLMKGGVGEAMIGLMHGQGFSWFDYLVFAVVAGVLGVFLGLIGAVLAVILDRYRRRGMPTNSS